jgi:hypothetical protein
MIADQFDEHFWVQFDTMGGLAAESYQAEKEWVLSIDGFIEHVSHDKTDDFTGYGSKRLPLNWEIV